MSHISIPTRLLLMREMAGLTEEELAERASTGEHRIPSSRISQWERGIRTPRLQTIRALCRACDVPLSVFVDDDPAGLLVKRA